MAASPARTASGGAARASPRPIRLGSALFNADHGHLADEVRRCEAAGLDFLHLDVFDGYFVPDMGFPPRTLATLRKLTAITFEVHLGVLEPLRFAPQLAEAGVELVLFHLESARMPYETAFAIQGLGMKAGVVASLGTPVSALEALVDRVDSILLLSRVTGEGSRGASFDAAVLPRMEALRAMIDRAGGRCELQAAGGVNRDNVGALVGAGATTLSVGSGIYKAQDMRAEVAGVRALAEAARSTTRGGPRS